jgi:ankyrin repeat protein
MRLVADVSKLHKSSLISRTVKQTTTLLLREIEDGGSAERRLTYVHNLCDAVAHNISSGRIFKRPPFHLRDISFDPKQDWLSAAAAVGDQATVTRLLSERFDPDIRSKFFGYASGNAARKGQKGMLALILTPDKTSHVTLRFKCLVIAAFSEACRAGQPNIVEYLLDFCSRVEWLDADWLQEHGGNAFETAAKHGHANILKRILHYIPTIKARKELLAQSLYYASADGHIEAVRFLLGIGAALNMYNHNGGPLHLASRAGHAHLVRLLLEQGATYYAVSRGDPLYLASMNGHTDVIQILLDYGADINAVGRDGSALAQAAENSETTMVRFLLHKGINIKKNGNGDSALGNAAERGHVEIVTLLAEWGVDVNGPGDWDPPILRAMIYGQHHMVKKLVELGAKEVDPLKSERSEGFRNGMYPLSR